MKIQCVEFPFPEQADESLSSINSSFSKKRQRELDFYSSGEEDQELDDEFFEIGKNLKTKTLIEVS